jgi:hypothetical protein
LIESGSNPTPGAPTVATQGYWTLDPNYIGTNLGLYSVNGTANLGVEATSPEQSMVLGLLSANESLYQVVNKIMFTVFHQQEDSGDIPLDVASIGVAYKSANLNNPLGSDGNSIGYFQHGELNFGGSTITTGLPTYVPSDYIDFCMNISGGSMKIWVRVNGGNWNNNASANPATNSNGITVSMDGTGFPGDPNAIYPALQPGAVNFIDAMEISRYTYSIPSNFVAL